MGSLAPSSSILLYEMIGGVTFLSCLLPFYLYFSPQEYLIPNALDFIYLLLFAIFCTICMNILQIQALKSISFTMNLSYNLEPVYSIILAMIILVRQKT